VTVQIVGGGLFKRWADLLGEPDWLDDPRFATDQGRGDHGALIGERMASWCAVRTTADAVSELASAGIPCGELLSPAELLENEHVIDANMFQHVDYPGVDTAVPIADHPVRYSHTPVDDFRRAPTLGEHTEEILTELDYTSNAISELRRSNAI